MVSSDGHRGLGEKGWKRKRRRGKRDGAYLPAPYLHAYTHTHTKESERTALSLPANLSS